MTLIIGMKTTDGVLISADKALSTTARISTARSKLRNYLDSHVIMGFSGSVSDIQGVENGLEEIFSAYFRQNKFNLDAFGKMLFSAEFKEFSKKYNAFVNFSGLIVAGEKGNSKIYKIFPLYRNGVYTWGTIEIVPREKDYDCIGSGDIAGATLLLENFYSQNRIPTKEEAVRLCALINYLVSLFTTGVSSSFEVVALTEKNVLTLPADETQKVSFEVRKIWNFTKTLGYQTFKNLDFSKWLITYIFNGGHKKPIKRMKSKGNTIVILDDMYKKQGKIYSKLLKLIPDAKVFENPSEAVSYIKEHTADIKGILVDRVVKSKQATLKFLEDVRELVPRIPIVVMGQKFAEDELNEFSERGVSRFILKSELAQDEEKILKTLQLTEDKEKMKWHVIKEF
ncbi:MAG: hypothetical protein DRG83_05985 [Deltaproteobacteria bacterium]|nr:MAG: hypothetical protein DRG83_05985 [Deltaproteobacteria bacterium]